MTNLDDNDLFLKNTKRSNACPEPNKTAVNQQNNNSLVGGIIEASKTEIIKENA